MSDEERARVLQMRHEGVSTNAIAAQLGRSHNMIYRVFKEDTALRCKQEAIAAEANDNAAMQPMQMPPNKTVDQALDELMRNAMANMDVAKPAQKANAATKRQAPNAVTTPLPVTQGNQSAFYRLVMSKVLCKQATRKLSACRQHGDTKSCPSDPE